MLTASCETNTSANGMAWHDKKSHVAHHFYHIDLRNTMMPLALATMAVQDQKQKKSHFAPHFDHLNLRNVMVILTVPSATCDAAAGTNGGTWPKLSCYTSFWSSWPKSTMVSLTMLFASHSADASALASSDQKTSCCTSLLSSWPKKCNGAII